MHDSLYIGDFADSLVEKADGTIAMPGLFLDFSGLDLAKLGVGGTFHIECRDAEGNLRWADKAKNGVTNNALNDILNVYLRATAQTTAWYIGLVDNQSFSSFSPNDTISSHSGWIENSQYSNTSRPQWSPAAAASQGVTNTTTVNFNMTPTSGATIKGLFVNSDSTLNGTVGNLFSTAAFSGGNQTVNNGDTLKVTYTVSATSS